MTPSTTLLSDLEMLSPARASALAVLFAATISVRLADAHDQWLEVEPVTANGATRAKVYLMLGEHYQEAQAISLRNKGRLTFQIATEKGKRDVSSELREDQTPIATLAGKATGTWVLAVDASSRTIELSSKKFGEYLLEERLLDVLLARAAAGREDGVGRERYTRHLKTLVQLGDKLDPVATQAVGQDLEIIPEANPFAVAPGGTLTVKVLFKGKPLVGRAVTEANRYRGDVSTRTVRTDANGKAQFSLTRAGDHMIRLVHMEPSKEPDVEWRSYWANLTFSLPDRAPADATPKKLEPPPPAPTKGPADPVRL